MYAVEQDIVRSLMSSDRERERERERLQIKAVGNASSHCTTDRMTQLLHRATEGQLWRYPELAKDKLSFTFSGAWVDGYTPSLAEFVKWRWRTIGWESSITATPLSITGMFSCPIPPPYTASVRRHTAIHAA